MTKTIITIVIALVISYFPLKAGTLMESILSIPPNCDEIFGEVEQISILSPSGTIKLTVKQQDDRSVLNVTDFITNNLVYSSDGFSRGGYEGFFRDFASSISFSPDSRYILTKFTVYNPYNVFSWYKVIDTIKGDLVSFDKEIGEKTQIIRGNSFFINNKFLVSFSLDFNIPHPVLLNLETGAVLNIQVLYKNLPVEIPFDNASYVSDAATAFTTGNLPNHSTGLYMWNFLRLNSEHPHVSYPQLISLDQIFKYQPAGKMRGPIRDNVIGSQKISGLNFVFSPKANKYYGVIIVDQDFYIYRDQMGKYINSYAYLVEIEPLMATIKSLGNIQISKVLSTPLIDNQPEPQLLYSQLRVKIENNFVLVLAKPNHKDKQQVIFSAEIK